MSQSINNEDPMNLVLVEHKHAVKDSNVDNTIKAMEPDMAHGAEWPAAFFEQHLGKQNHTAAFGQAMHRLQLRMEAQGYHLTARGKNATSWWIEKVENTGRVVNKMHRRAMSYLRRSAVLANSTVKMHAAKLDENQQRQLEHKSRIQALRYLTASRIR